MKRGFGIDASVPVDVATPIAARVEELGYGSFWVNGSPHGGALNILESVATATSLPLGVGVFPLPEISAESLVREIDRRHLPEDRLLLGIGSGRRPGALAEVREGAELLRSRTAVTVVTGAVGPKMISLAAEVSDGVIFTWSMPAEIERSRSILEEAALHTQRGVPEVISFIRCAILPEARTALDKRTSAYSRIPHYQAVFERNGVVAEDTVVTGSGREDMIDRVIHEESVLDHSVIRAIPGENTVDSIGRLVIGLAP